VLVQDKQISALKRAIQQLSDDVLASPATPWTELPECLCEAVVEHLEGDKKASAKFRLVCHAWREAHDRYVTVLKPNGAPPDARVWKKFVGVKAVDLNRSLVNDNDVRALAPLTGLTSLDLNSCNKVTGKGLRALAPLTGLTSLNLGGSEDEYMMVTDVGLRALAPLTNLTSLNLVSCNKVTLEGLRALAPLTGLTSLDLSCCEVTDEGVRALAPLTSLTNLCLGYNDDVTDEGLRALAPLTALTSLDLSCCEDRRGVEGASPVG